VYFYEVENTEFYPIVKRSQLFIRPTYIDGYGVSIAEALHCKVPSIASDVCNRPEGTVLFKSRDITDLLSKVLDVIERYSMYKHEVSKIKMRDYASDLIDVYHRTVGSRLTQSNMVVDPNGK
jgi:glycosyltransferase involved in cell wall biosynthesis